MTDTRDSFEKWCESQEMPPWLLNKRSDGTYENVFTDGYWSAWQAAMQAGAGDAQDAARYRVLRDTSNSSRLNSPYASIRKHCGSGYAHYEINGDDLDAAIDNAQATEGK